MRVSIPDLKFQNKRYSALHVPHDLQLFLYVGASKLKAREASRRLLANTLGEPEIGRLNIVEGLHDFLLALNEGGLSDRTFNAHYASLKVFFSFVDERNYELNSENVEQIFVVWANDIAQRFQRNEIKTNTAFYWVGKVAQSLGDILKVDSRTLLQKTRLGKGKKRPPDFSVSAKHKTFEETREFIRDLLDLIEVFEKNEALSTVPLRLTTALSAKVDYNFGGNGRNISVSKVDEAGLARTIFTGNLQSERSFMNLRLFCELHYFIFFTGANLEDVKNLELASVSGWVEDNGRRFRAYKKRKGGEVCYKIYEKFVGHYDSFLGFRSSVVARRPSSLLFPFLKEDKEHQSNEFQPRPLRLLLRRLGRPYIPPGAMRTYFLNDVFDFTGNATLAAGAGQHNVKTFVKSYMRPNLEVAAVQWTKFYATVQESQSAVAPGLCSALHPVKIAVLEQLGAEPNCSNSAGCLFCEQYRGVVSFDYIWSLLTYRKLKNNEGFVGGGRDRVGILSSVQSVLHRIDQVVEEFRDHGNEAEKFYEDALSRCIGDDHHPAWAGYLELMELT